MNLNAQSNLEQRGIFNVALSAGWTHTVQQGTHFYRYPVYAPDSNAIVAYRLKALPGQTGAKYLWLEGKPAAAAYYRHPRVHLKGAIAAAGGVLFIANGEPSVLAYVAAGMLNVLSWFGEGSVPATLADDLQRFGVREVRYPADKDAAGRKSAARVREALHSTTIKFRALAWGDDVPERGDANDLWRMVGFDAAEFQRRVSGLKALDLTPDDGRGGFETRPYNLNDAGTVGEVSPDLIVTLAARLGVTGWRANGWSSRNVLSPFRDEKRASAAFNRDSGVLHDFGTGESYGFRDVAERLGIDWRAYQNNVPAPYASGSKPGAKPKAISLLKQAKETTGSFNPLQGASGSLADGCFEQPAHIINQRWTSELDPADVLQHRTILLRAPMATGKTELVKRLTGYLANNHNLTPNPSLTGRGALTAHSNLENNRDVLHPLASQERGQGGEVNVRILYINHLKSLTAHAAERLGLELYDNIPAEFLPMATNMAISYNSLHKLVRSDGKLPDYDLLVVDECEQVQPYIGASTFRPGEALRNYGIFRQLCAQSKHVLFMDAHAGQINADWLAEIRGDCQVIHNTFRHEWGRLTFHENASHVVAQAIHLMHLNEGCVVIPTNSRSFSETLYHHLKQIFGDAGILLVNSENSESAPVQYVTVHINEELPKLRALICSPSYSTGLDVTAHVRAVCGIFFQQPTLPSDNLQMMGRYRNAQERHAYVQPCERDLITDENVIFRHEVAQTLRTAVAADFTLHDLPAMPPEQAEILKLQCRYEAAHNRQRQNMLMSFVALAEAEGYVIATQEGDSITLAMQLKQSREAVAEERKQRTLHAEPVSRDLLESHRHRGTLTPQIRAGHERFLIEDTLGLTLTPELYDRFRRPADRRALRRFTDLTAPRGLLQERDRHQAAGHILIRQRSHYTEAQDIVSAVLGLLDIAPGDNNLRDAPTGIREGNMTGRGGFETRPYNTKSTSDPSSTVLREAEIEQRAGAYIRANLPRIQRVIDHRFDLSAETLPVLKRILKSVGLMLQGRQVMVNRERFYVYGLDAKQLALMEMYAAARRAYLAEQPSASVTQNTGISYIHSRDLSNFGERRVTFSQKPHHEMRIPMQT